MQTGYLPNDKKITQYFSLIITGTTAAALVITIVCLTHNIDTIYYHLYYIPIIIAAICYPKKGFYFTLLLTILFLFITFVITKGEEGIFYENIIRSIVFIGVGAIASTLSEVLREDSLKYQRLFDNSGAATAVISKSGKIIYCNKDFERITRYDFKELKKKFLPELISSDDRDEIFKKPEDTLQKPDVKKQIHPKELKNAEIKIVKKNGETCYTLASLHKINELGIILLSVIDVSLKVKTEKILKIKEERYKNLFQQSTDAIFIHSVKGKIFDANKNACKLTGYTLDELKEINLTDLHPDTEAEKIEKCIESLENSGHCEFESIFKNSNGNTNYIDIRSVIVDKDTMVAQSIIRDITLRKKNDNALHTASKKLSILSSITRHDIINQIMVALANLEFAEMDSKDENILPYLDKAGASVRIIQKQIEFSKDYQDMGGKPPKWQNIEEIIQISLNNQNIPENISVYSDVAGVEIYADHMLEKVFSNLIGNSLMHGGNFTEIKIMLGNDDGFFRINYSDNGSGIPNDKKEFIFRAGYGSNQGFGLYLVREILAITGISIDETGIFGKGVNFEIKVPANDIRFA